MTEPEDFMYRRHLSRQHLEVLAQYMERYPALALASARSREGHLQSRRMWEKIARTLNRIDENVTKSGRSWSRYWADLKFKIRRKYAIIQKCQSDRTQCSINLNPLEDRIVKILTDDEGNLLPTASVYHQMKSYSQQLHYPVKNNSSNRKSVADDTKIDDSGGLSTDEQTQDDYLLSNTAVRTEHIILPETTDIKPNVNHINNLRNEPDPIQIVLPGGEGKSIEDLRKELVEFELRKQKELFEMEKQFKRERHELEMSILKLRKQLMVKELEKL